MKVAVVTPTIASEHLAKCIDSVDKQTYEDIVHYIFIDGCQYEPKAREILVGSPKTRMIELEENVGKGWYGHRVYAACSFLVNADVICYLDEDNFFEPNHIETVVKKQTRTLVLENTNGPALFEFENIIITKTGLTTPAGWCVAVVVEQQNQTYNIIILGAKNKKDRLDKLKEIMYTYIIK
jgi:glycosyltransferase involved in cell wall biosynthesis